MSLKDNWISLRMEDAQVQQDPKAGDLDQAQLIY